MTEVKNEQVDNQQIEEMRKELDALKKKNNELEKENNEFKARIKELEEENAALRAGVDSQKLARDVEKTASNEEINIDNLEIKTRFRKARIDRQEVKNVLGELKDPYKSEIFGFIKKADIEGLQKYLNGLIDKGDIDKAKLGEKLTEFEIGLDDNGHILVDRRFGPQTLWAIKVLNQMSEGEKKEDKKEEKIDGVAVKEESEVDLPKAEVKGEDLVNAPEGAQVTIEGEGVNKDETNPQKIEVIVKVGEQVQRITVIVTIKNGKMTVKEGQDDKQEEKNQDGVKVDTNKKPVPDSEVTAEDLVTKPDDVTVKLEDGSEVKKDVTGPQRVTVIVEKDGKVLRRITVIVTIDGDEMSAEEEKQNDEQKEDPYKDVKVKEEKVALPKDREVMAEDLVTKPDDVTVKLEDGSEVKKDVTDSQRVVVIVEKEGVEPKEIKVIVTIDGDEMSAKEELEEEKKNSEQNEDFENVKVKEQIEKPKDDKKIEADELLEGLPSGAKAEFKDGKGIDLGEKDEQVITIQIKDSKGEIKREIRVVVRVGDSRIEMEEKKDVFEGIEVKEKIEKPEDKEVEAKDLLDGLPDDAKAEFKNGEGVDKTKEGEVQEVVVVVTIGDKTKEFPIIVKVEGNIITLEDKEKKEAMEESAWFENLKIKDLGHWEENGDFKFNDGLIDEGTGKLTVNGKEVGKLAEGGNGFGYLVDDDHHLLIGNFEDGKLNGKGVEFSSSGDEIGRDTDGNGEPDRDLNFSGRKSCGDFEQGILKEGRETETDGKLVVHIEIKDKEPKICYTDDKSLSFEYERDGDDLYIKNREDKLKLKDANKYHALFIMRILYDYKDKEGKFMIDSGGEHGMESKNLLRQSSTGETEEVWKNVDNFVEAPFGRTEGIRLASWLNEYRDTHKEFKSEEYGEFDSNGNFVFKDGVEQADENGKIYIEYNKEKYYKYEDGINGLGYKVGKGCIYIGSYKEGKKEGQCTYIRDDGSKYVGNCEQDKREGQGTMIWENGNKFEGEYRDDKRENGTFTIVEPKEIAGEYKVERDDKGLKIVSEGENKGKYIDDEEWKIEDKEDTAN